MKIGISTWCFREQSIDEALKQISLLGIKYVELFANDFHLDPRLGKLNARRISSQLSHYDLVPLSIHAPFAKIDGKGSKAKAKQIWKCLIEKTFELMDKLKISSVVIHPQALMLSSKDIQQPLNLPEQLLSDVISCARKGGKKVLLENLNPPNFSAYYTLDEIIDLLERIGDTRTALCFDTCHCMSSGNDPVVEIKKYKSRIQQIHLSDNFHKPLSDSHLPIGAGCIDWYSFFSGLKQGSFNGSLILEINGGKNAFDQIKRSLTFLSQLLGDSSII